MAYEFGEMSFSSKAWIKNGESFSGVSLVEIEMVNAGAFRLEVVNTDGNVISIGPRDNPHGGWSTFSFSAGMDPPVVSATNYALRLVNAAPGIRQVKSGIVNF